MADDGDRRGYGGYFGDSSPGYLCKAYVVCCGGNVLSQVFSARAEVVEREEKWLWNRVGR